MAKKNILNNKQKEIVRESILNEIEKTVGRLKNAARVALHKNGLEARVWSKGFDKKAFKNRVNYAWKHNHGQRTRET